MMTIDEAIEHAEWAANNCEGECSEEHRQLAEWLKELKQWKTLVEGIDLRPESLMKPFQPNVSDLESENDRLKAENKKLRSERDALRIHGVNPDDGAYITALDATMDESRATMQELGIEVE